MSKHHLREPDPLAEELGTPAHVPHAGAAPKVSARACPELWAGVECTVNRVGDEYFDQLERNGHGERGADLDLFAELGVTALRYPVLWERTAPAGLEQADWSWADARLPRLRELGVHPIVGLVHHGSGPRHTHLLDPNFAEGLAEFARAVAERFPWVEAYTPVNEPLTTARFSALYGHWYPHARDGKSFARAIVIQCRATVLAMRAIRAVNPRARLVQTDDLGKTYSTPALAYQAEFDNARRWLGWDLLCGRVDREHLLWKWLIGDGIAPAELEWFLANPCPPDVIGINHYLTSERFLDQRLGRYPEWTHGGNGRHRYADVEAVRVLAGGTAGPYALLREAWERYGLPLAVTEAHLGCTREEQLRWLLEVWRAARRLRNEGAAVQAVTVWSLLGAYDWNSLLTRSEGSYEPGVFDLRGRAPRPTALAWLMRHLAAGFEPEHPVLEIEGWWRRPERLLYPPLVVDTTRNDGGRARDAAPGRGGEGTNGRVDEWTTGPAAVDLSGSSSLPLVHSSLPSAAVPQRHAGRCRSDGGARRIRPLLITGATGTLGRAFGRLCEVRGLPYQLARRQDMDIAVPFSIEDALDGVQPWAVVNTAGYVRVDDAEREPERCFRENRDGAAALAAACARRGIPLVTFSSDLVFDGAKQAPYAESDPVAPLNVYGRSKAAAERRVLELHAGALVVRTSACFGPWDPCHFLAAVFRELKAGRPFAAADDAVISPTYVPDLVHASLDLLLDGATGIWHLANQGSLTWHEFARRAAGRAALDTALLQGCPTEQLGLAAPRPRYSALGSERGLLLPSLDDALDRFFREREAAPQDAGRQREPVGRSDCGAAAA